MKKIALFLSMAAFLAGCSDSKDNTAQNPDNAVGFKSFVEKPTKALSNNATALTQDFGVFGYWDKVGDTPLISELLPDFMFNQRVEYKNGSFTYTPIKYWPNTGDVEFYAYAPYNSSFLKFTNPTVATQKGYPVFDYTVASTITSQEDVLVSAAEDQDGVIVPSVNLAFDHAMTKVAFAAKTSADYSTAGTVVKITGITLSNILNAGSFSFDRYVNDVTNATWWSLKTTKANYIPGLATPGGVEIKHKYEGQPDGSYLVVNGLDEYMLLVPQAFTTADATLTVNYIVSYGATVEPFTKVFELKGTTDWAPGMFITYAIDISLNMVTFTATVNKWTEATQNFVIVGEDEE